MQRFAQAAAALWGVPAQCREGVTALVAGRETTATSAYLGKDAVSGACLSVIFVVTDICLDCVVAATVHVPEGVYLYRQVSDLTLQVIMFE